MASPEKSLLDAVLASGHGPGRTRFLTGLAHKIRNPLNAVKLHLELLRRRLPDDDAAMSSLAVIDAEIARISAVLEDLNELSCAADKPKEPKDLVAMTHEVVATLETVAHDRDIDLVFRRPDRPVQVPVVPCLVRRLMTHLIDNALESVQRRGTVEIELSLGDGVAIFSVRDDGAGFSPDALEHVFEPFYSTRSNGTGLGLSVCRAIAEAHGGVIRAATNGHTAVTVELPIDE